MDKPQVLLEHYLKTLKLPAIVRDYQSVAADCLKKKTGYAQYLQLLCEREILAREERASERRLKAAKFPVLKTVEGFDFNQQPTGSARGLLR